MSKEKENRMREIRIEKITLNIGVGKDTSRLDHGIKLLTNLTDAKPVKTITKKRIPGWGLRPGLPIGCKVTIRKEKAGELLVRLLDAKANSLTEKQFDDYGNVAFGIHEYIDIKGAKYDPDIGMMGLQVCITLQRAGFRTKRRVLVNRKITKRHKITKEEAIEFMKNKFNVTMVGEEK